MNDIQERLYAIRDDKNRDFMAKLAPTVPKENILGCRAPAMRTLAKSLAKNETRFEFLNDLPHRYLEENSLHGALLPTVGKDVNVVVKYLKDFLPYIDNWATCDSTCAGLKIFKKHPDVFRANALEWLKSDKVYTVRFALVGMIDYLLDDAFLASDLDAAVAVKSDEYYVNMALAWYLSFALIKQYEATIPYFTTPVTSKWVHNKAIQKARESFRIDEQTKAYLNSLKIK